LNILKAPFPSRALHRVVKQGGDEIMRLYRVYDAMEDYVEIVARTAQQAFKLARKLHDFKGIGALFIKKVVT